MLPFQSHVLACSGCSGKNSGTKFFLYRRRKRVFKSILGLPARWRTTPSGAFMNWHTLDVTITGAVATVILNRPRVHNAFNETAIKELEHSFRMFGDREEVRVIVLTGSGTTFCAGADLSWMKRMAEL